RRGHGRGQGEELTAIEIADGTALEGPTELAGARFAGAACQAAPGVGEQRTEKARVDGEDLPISREGGPEGGRVQGLDGGQRPIDGRHDLAPEALDQTLGVGPARRRLVDGTTG